MSTIPDGPQVLVDDPVFSPGMTDPSDNILNAILECLCGTLASNGAPVCCCSREASVLPSWDHCGTGNCGGDCEGQAYVAVESVYPTETFPFEDFLRTNGAPCSHERLAMIVKLGVLRCAAVGKGKSGVPDHDARTTAARKVMRDAFLMRAAVRCCVMKESLLVPWTSGRRDIRVGRWRSLEEAGGCVGGELTITIELSDCSCPEIPGTT